MPVGNNLWGYTLKDIMDLESSPKYTDITSKYIVI